MNNKNNNSDSQKLPILKNSELGCPHFQDCSGCEISTELNNPPIFQEAKTYFEKHKVTDLHLFVGNVNFWRFRAKLVVRGTSENPLIGLYKKGTHDVLDIPFCKVHHPNINLALAHIKKFIKEKGIEPYNESTKKGTLRYLQLVVHRKTGKVQLTFVLNQDFENDLTKWEIPDPNPDTITTPFWHSIWLNLINQKQIRF